MVILAGLPRQEALDLLWAHDVIVGPVNDYEDVFTDPQVLHNEMVVETDHRITNEISLIPTVGHTPGHVSVLIRSQGEEALITGDFMHHPCQIAHPEWCSTADSDPETSRQTRERMLADLSSRPVLVIGTHFAGATAGRIVKDGDTYRMDV